MSGYNEDAYREARQSAIDLACPFERALLSQCAQCFKSKKLLLAEREVVTCTERAANELCMGFLEALHHNARFALHMDPNQAWPFGKEIRAQCGGILGLKAALGEPDSADIARLIDRALETHGSIDQFPYSEIMRGVVHYQPRKRKP